MKPKLTQGYAYNQFRALEKKGYVGSSEETSAVKGTPRRNGRDSRSHRLEAALAQQHTVTTADDVVVARVMQLVDLKDAGILGADSFLSALRKVLQ